jgi:hypothetical protein
VPGTRFGDGDDDRVSRLNSQLFKVTSLQISSFEETFSDAFESHRKVTNRAVIDIEYQYHYVPWNRTRTGRRVNRKMARFRK